MRNIRNKNAPPDSDLVQVYLRSSWDIVTDIYKALPLLTALGDAIEAGGIEDFLTAADIDTLAELNAILTDATLGDFASQAEAEAGTGTTQTMNPLRVAQAIAVMAAGLLNKYDGTSAPGVTDDSSAGYSVGSYWVDTTNHETYRCSDASVGAAVWIHTTLSADELAVVALTGDSDDLIEGTVQLLLTVSERAVIAAVDQVFTSTEKGKLTNIEIAATADQTDSEIEAAYNNQVLQVSAGEKTAGTETAVRRFSPEDIADMATGGGGGLTPVFKTADFTAVAGEKYYVDSTSGPVVVTMPAGADAENIKVMDVGHVAGTNSITLVPDGSETIDGDTSFVIDQNEGDVDVTYRAGDTNWYVSADGTPDVVNVNSFYTGFGVVRDLTGTAEDFVEADAGQLVTGNNASASVYTIPANSAVPYDIGTTLPFFNKGAGEVTIALTTDTLSSTDNKCAQGKTVTCLKVAATEWWVIGGSA
jgi:hypothetical protein